MTRRELFEKLTSGIVGGLAAPLIVPLINPQLKAYQGVIDETDVSTLLRALLHKGLCQEWLRIGHCWPQDDCHAIDG